MNPKWPVWQPQQEPSRRISLWKNKSGGERMNFTSDEEISPAQNSMTGSKPRKRFLWLGNNPERNGERRLRSYCFSWEIEEPHTGRIVFKVHAGGGSMAEPSARELKHVTVEGHGVALLQCPTTTPG